jgi:CheY-like chemotaxis protein
MKILVVEDINMLRMFFEEKLREAFPDADIHSAANLEVAREQLKSNAFDAVVTDCGFPPTEKDERVNGNRNGVTLLSEMREGKYGKYHSIIPVAFNSAEMYPDKANMALSCGGNTRCFRKGSLYEVMPKGTYDENFTPESVAGGSTRWLQQELTEEKIQERKAKLMPKKPVCAESKRGWFF